MLTLKSAYETMQAIKIAKPIKVEALDELGFDTSAIKGTQSMAVAVLNVNSALLGLPERKDDDVKQS